MPGDGLGRLYPPFRPGRQRRAGVRLRAPAGPGPGGRERRSLGGREPARQPQEDTSARQLDQGRSFGPRHGADRQGGTRAGHLHGPGPTRRRGARPADVGRVDPHRRYRLDARRGLHGRQPLDAGQRQRHPVRGRRNPADPGGPGRAALGLAARGAPHARGQGRGAGWPEPQLRRARLGFSDPRRCDAEPAAQASCRLRRGGSADAAARHPGQGDGRRRLCAGSAPVRPRSCPRGAPARLRRDPARRR